MKYLFLMRHAQAETLGFQGSDHDRQLTELGEQQARNMAEKIGEQLSKIEFILVSSAARTLATAEIVAKHIALSNDQIKIDQRIYNAESDVLSEVVHELPDIFSTVLLVAHNPGVSELCFNYTDQGISFRPASACLLKADVECWREIGSGTQLLWQKT